MNASLIENIAVTAVGAFLAVWGVVRGDAGITTTGLGLLAVKGGTFVTDSKPSP